MAGLSLVRVGIEKSNLFDRPIDFFQEHLVHWWYDLGRDID